MVAEDMQALVQDKMEDQEEELDNKILVLKDQELNLVNQEILELLDLVMIQEMEVLVLPDTDTRVVVEQLALEVMELQLLEEMVEMVKV